MFLNPILMLVLLVACGTKTPGDVTQEKLSPSHTPRGKPTATASVRPNIILILTDDQDVDSMAYMPNVQSQLVQQGTTFTNYFVNISLCCPSRATILRGQYGHNTHILGNRPPDGGFENFYALSEEDSTIATWLQSAGYRTALIGKYLNGYPNGVDPTYVPPGWDEFYSLVKGDPMEMYSYTLNENGRLKKYGQKDKDYSTDVDARLAIDFVNRAASGGKPFFLYVAPYAPHGPAIPARRHTKLFIGAKVPQSPSFNEKDVRDKPGYVRDHKRSDEEDIKGLNRLYRRRLQTLQAVDEMVASLVTTLQAAGQLDRTYIFYSSDNGFLMGQHRLGAGKVAPYEESIKVPLVIRGPGVPAGRKIDKLAGNIDLAPTWAELAGTSVPDFVDGRSLVALFKQGGEGGTDWRRGYLIEQGIPDEEPPTPEGESNGPALTLLDLNGVLVALSPLGENAWDWAYDIPAFKALRMEKGLYVEYQTGERELYNLINDSYQLNNIAATVDVNLIDQLSAWLKALSLCKAENCRKVENG
jgi:arylsulfatase A-like enzyme